MKKYISLLMLFYASALITACGTPDKLTTTRVTYLSVKTRHVQPTNENPVPDKAKIMIGYYISSEAELVPVVYNKTSEIMIIDQTMSFFVNSDGYSTSYYDPTIRTTSTTEISSSTSGASVNLGSIASVLGIGGAIGALANGVNVGEAGTTGSSTTNTTYTADRRQISIGPHSNYVIPKVFKVTKLQIGKWLDVPSKPVISESDSYCTFSVCITYSIDEGRSFDKLTTNFYVDSHVVVPVEKNGRVNDALRKVLTIKPDALYEPWWFIAFNNSNRLSSTQSISDGFLFDYQ